MYKYIQTHNLGTNQAMDGILEVIISISAIATIITGSSAWYFKNNINNHKTYINDAMHQISSDVKSASETMKQDFKEHSVHVNDRFEKIYDHMEIHKKEIGLRFDRHIDNINETLRELSRNIERIKDDVHSQEKSFLQLRIDITEKFATKEELKKLEKHVEKISTLA